MFYERLNAICKERGKKLTPLLIELGIGTSATGRWQKGTLPNSDILGKLAEALDVSTDYLLCKTDDPTPANKKDTAGDPEFIEIQRLHSKLSAKDKERFMKLLRIQFAEDFPEDDENGIPK